MFMLQFVDFVYLLIHFTYYRIIKVFITYAIIVNHSSTHSQNYPESVNKLAQFYCNLYS